jgi:hypothetical protein
LPRIDTYTARGRDGVLRLPGVSADSFGAKAFQGLGELGDSITKLGERLDENQGKLDIIKMSGDFAIRKDQATAELLKNPDMEHRHGDLLESELWKIHDQIISENPRSSSAVQRTFREHVAKSYAPTAIELMAAGREQQAQQQAVEVDQHGQEIATNHGRHGFIAGNVPGQAVGTTEHLLQGMVSNGTILPKAAQAMREGWANIYWEQRSQADPMYVQGVVESGKHGPDDFPMEAKKSLYYGNLAQNQINERQKAEDKRQAAIKDEVHKSIVSKMWGAGETHEEHDVAPDIEANRNLYSAKEYQTAMTENRQVQNARKLAVNEGRTSISQYTQSGLLELAKRAKYEPELLKHHINNDIVKRHVFNKMDLLPDDAAPIYTAISEAMAHHESGDSVLRKAQTDALQSLNVFVPASSMPKDAFTLNNIQDSMKRQLRVEMDANPNMKPSDIHITADTIRAQGEVRILSAQKLSAKQIDEELFAMERHWGAISPDIATNHKLKPDARNKMEKQYPLLRGLFKIHDARRERWENLVKIAEDRAGEGK